LDLKTECVAALAHEYDFQGDKVRLDNVAIWTSAHITEDAEKASWLRLYLTLFHTDTLLGDPFLLPVFRHLLRQRLDDESYVMLLDLVLGCSNENTDAIVAALENINQPEITQAIYFRVVSLYFFRFHREKERKALRRLLAELRRIHPFAALPSIRSPS
jgi:hypothetical protein